jgi:hypothetical protein
MPETGAPVASVVFLSDCGEQLRRTIRVQDLEDFVEFASFCEDCPV